MNIYTALNVPASLASLVPLNVGTHANVLRYLDGPMRILVSFEDDKGRTYRLPMSPGDQFTLDGNRTFQRCEVGNTDAVVGRIDLLIGRGDLRSNPTLAGATESPRYGTVSVQMLGQAGRYAACGLTNLSTSLYVAEVTGLTVYPNSTDKFYLTLGAIDYTGIQASAVPFNLSSSSFVKLTDYVNGNTAIKRWYGGCFVGLTMMDVFDSIPVGKENYFEEAGVGAAGIIQPVHFDFTNTPITLRPNQTLALSSIAMNVTISAAFQWTERRVL